MRLRKTIRNLTEPEKEQFETYLEAKLSMLASIVETHYPDEDALQVDVTIEKLPKRTVFIFTYAFEFPHGHCNAEEAKHTITEVIDLASDKMERQLRAHFEKLTEK